MRFTDKNDYLSSQSMGVSIVGASVLIDQIFGYAWQCVWTGTPAGNIIHQASNDGTTWFDIDTQAAGGAAGTKLFEKNGAFYKYTRIIFNQTGSSGALTVKFFGKG